MTLWIPSRQLWTPARPRRRKRFTDYFTKFASSGQHVVRSDNGKRALRADGKFAISDGADACNPCPFCSGSFASDWNFTLAGLSTGTCFDPGTGIYWTIPAGVNGTFTVTTLTDCIRSYTATLATYVDNEPTCSSGTVGDSVIFRMTFLQSSGDNRLFLQVYTEDINELFRHLISFGGTPPTCNDSRAALANQSASGLGGTVDISPI